MSKFFERVVFEYPALKKWKSFTKDSSYRIRVIEKKGHDGLTKRFLDIREYIVKNEFSALTESGVCLNKENLEILIQILIDARKEYLNHDGSRE